MSKLILILFYITSIHGYHYNGYPYSKNWPEAPRYPDHCCPLEWVNMTRGQELPKDWIEAGTFMGRKFAFTRKRVPGLGLGLKSERKDDNPYAYDEHVPNPFPILTNPNKCFVDWHTTKSSKEIPQSTDRIFFPSTGWSKYGDFAQHDGIPGDTNSKNGDIAKLTSLYSFGFETVRNKKLLFVDCVKSFDSMYNLILKELKFDKKAISKLERAAPRKEYARKFFKNNWPEPSTTTMNFTVTASKYFNLTLNSTTGFTLRMDNKTNEKFRNSSLINKLLADIGFQKDQYDKDTIWNFGENWGNNDGKNATTAIILNAFSDLEFASKLKVDLPPHSSATVTAISDFIVGLFSFTAIYELFPKKAGDNLITIKLLRETMIKKFKFHELCKFRETDRGTFLVTFEGTMSIDAGSDVYLEIVTEQLDGQHFSTSTSSPITTTTTEYIMS